MKQKDKTTLRKIQYGKKEGFYLIIRGLEAGTCAGLISVLYRFLISASENTLARILSYISGSTLKTAVWFLILALLGLAVAGIVQWEPTASGSGIPQIMGEMKGYLSPKWWKVLISKLCGGSLSILAGLSLGREGPSIQLGGMAAKGVAKATNADRTTELRMISCGGGAGLAAAFNAPLAGVMFVLEEIHHTIDKSILCMGIVATITADFISKLFFGQKNIFSYETSNIPLRYYWLLVLLGILLGLFGAGYNTIMSMGQELFKKLRKIPPAIRMMLVFLISGAVGLICPQLLGGGHSMIILLTDERPDITGLAVLLGTKFLFSVFCFCSGAPGGIFFPFLVLGSYAGAIYGDLCISLLGLNENLWQEFAVIAMAGIFASIVRSPLTGIILVFEMTGNLESLLPLALVNLISYAVADLIGVQPIYQMLLKKILAQDHSDIKIDKSAEKILKTYVIPTGSPLNRKRIKDIDWGRHCLVVSIEREERAVTPKGETVLKEGDELVVLIGQRRFSYDNKRIENMITGKSI